MHVNKRFLISNLALVLIPVAMTSMAALLFLFIFARFFHSDVSAEDMKKLMLAKVELFEAKNSVLYQSPEKLEEAVFQQEIAKRLAAYRAGVVLVKNNRILFSSIKMTKIDSEKIMHAFTGYPFGETIELNGQPYGLHIQGLKYKDGSAGKAVLLIPATTADKSMEYFFIFVGVSFLLSFLVVNVLLSILIAKKILRPMQNLKQAVNAITQGNLDAALVEEGDTEIRELCHDFEGMRLKLKNALQLQEKYDENRKMLISSISHDLKTPLTSIRGYVEGIRDGVANTPEKMQQYLDTIFAKANQLDHLIEDLLLYSTLDMQQIPFQFEKTDIALYVQHWLDENILEFEKNNAQVTFEREFGEAKYVRLDRERMRRVINNVAQNAIKYCNKETCILQIFIRETHNRLILEFEDNGTGIGEEQLEKIFERFYRGDAARSNPKGSGLGLAIAKQIVEAHGGKIWAVSSPEKGTSVLISLEKL